MRIITAHPMLRRTYGYSNCLPHTDPAPAVGCSPREEFHAAAYESDTEIVLVSRRYLIACATGLLTCQQLVDESVPRQYEAALNFMISLREDNKPIVLTETFSGWRSGSIRCDPKSSGRQSPSLRIQLGRPQGITPRIFTECASLCQSLPVWLGCWMTRMRSLWLSNQAESKSHECAHPGG